ncbi:MAG: FkbM family methyltransferase [Rhizobiaceae bacterium]|nr:FkbM family methyltransferase [Rhizobiaceae bacterium]
MATKLFPKLKNRRICLDIGANIGNHALVFADHFDRVEAFEVNPRTFKLLSFNAELNEAIHPHNIGVSDSKGEMIGQGTMRNMASFSLEPGWTPEVNQSMTVEVDRLDDMLTDEQQSQVDFVKIDIEGHEPAALRGAADFLTRHSPVITIEIDKSLVENGQTTATQMLNEYGYVYAYEMADESFLGRLPSVLRKLGSTLGAVFLNRRHKPHLVLRKIDRLQRKSYSLAIYSKYPLD